MELNFQAIVSRVPAHPTQPVDPAVELDESADDILRQLEEINLEPLLTTPTAAAHADTELVRAIQRGDMAAFEAIFFKYQGQIYRTALAVTRDTGAAEEVLQDCF